jgi:hypothetical protein
MKNAGISVAIVQDIIGHESAAISANYTHIDDAAKRTALSAMPDVMERSGPVTQKNAAAFWKIEPPKIDGEAIRSVTV